MLAHLALTDGSSRERLAVLLWPDRADAQARKSLRQSLVVLRRALNGAREVLPGDRRQILSLASEAITVDARRFDTLVRTDSIASLQEAARIYSGPLLEHLSLPATPYLDWLDGERARFEDRACRVFAALAENSLALRDWSNAEAAARRLISVDPLRETGHRLAIQALAGAGRRSEALQQFHRLNGLLRQELDVGPDLDSLTLYRRIRNESNDRGHAIPAGTGDPTRQQPSTPVVPRPGLIVLPLRFGNGSAQVAELADGLTEEIIAALAAYHWFFVISALQASTYRDMPVAPARLAKELRVGYILDGSLRRSENRVHLRLNLTETGRGELVWSERIDCFVDEILQAKGDLVRQVANLVEPELLRYDLSGGRSGARSTTG